MAEILNTALFNDFAELMGAGLSGILTRHLEVSETYVATVRESFAAGNYKAMAAAAHPLKSSSLQIGATQVAECAAEIERLVNHATPDIARLLTLVEQLAPTQAETAEALRARIA